MASVNPDIMKKNNWFQGAIITGEIKDRLVQAGRSHAERETDALILLSQTCDLLHRELKAEPYAEFLCAYRIDVFDSSIAFGKSSRKLCLHVRTIGIFTMYFYDRLVIDRQILEEIVNNSPEQCLDHEALTILIDWISSKYTRPAFPDTFIQRINADTSQDRRLNDFDKNFPQIEKIFVNLNPGNRELEDPECYSIRILLLLGRQFSDTSEEVQESICKEFKKVCSCKGIHVSSIDCVTEFSMTLADLRTHRYWSKDYITHSHALPKKGAS